MEVGGRHQGAERDVCQSGARWLQHAVSSCLAVALGPSDLQGLPRLVFAEGKTSAMSTTVHGVAALFYKRSGPVLPVGHQMYRTCETTFTAQSQEQFVSPAEHRACLIAGFGASVPVDFGLHQ